MLTTERDGYSISTDPKRLDIEAIHSFLTTSYWAAGISIDIVRKSSAHSLCFGVYRSRAIYRIQHVVMQRVEP